MIDNKNNLIFIHIPRTGGHFITEVLNVTLTKNTRHAYPYYYKNKFRKQWKTYFKFTFVRNPWDRVVSAWSRTVARRYPWWNPHSINDDKYFLDTVKPNFNKFIKEEKFWILIHFKPQMGWIDKDLDFIGRYENLEKDLNEILKMNNIYCTLSGNRYSSFRRSYKEYFTTGTKEKIQKVYDEEIQKFEYIY